MIEKNVMPPNVLVPTPSLALSVQMEITGMMDCLANSFDSEAQRF